MLAVRYNSLFPLSIQDLQELLLVQVFLGFPGAQLDPQHLDLLYLPEKIIKSNMHTQLLYPNAANL